MKRQWAVPALLLLSAGCFDKKPTDPNATRVTLQIQSEALSLEEQTIPVGGTLQLAAKLYDAAGKEIESSLVDWRSTEPGVATVSATGLVTGVQVGTALVVASASGRSDTARVNVAERVSGAVECAPGDAGISLAVGEVYTTTGDRATTLCLQGGAAGAEFTYIPFFAAEVSGRSLPLSVSTSATTSVVGPPSPSVSAHSLPLRDLGLSPDDELHLRLRESWRRSMEPRLRAGVGLAPAAPRPSAVPREGDLMRLNVQVTGDGCSNRRDRHGRVIAVTERAVVVVDTLNPRTGLTDEAGYYRSFGMAFDSLVWKINTRNFGEPTDIDENGRVVIFYTAAVNEMTERGTDSYVGGFAYNRDLFPTTGKNTCAGSNYAEMFYMLAPDPRGTVNGNVRTTSFVRSTTVGVLAHEFQHLINDSRRLYVNKAPVWELTWLNEGLSHIAEELTFYETAGLAPRQNLGPLSQHSFRATRAFNEYQAANVERLIRYLRAPEANTLLGKDELSTRGAAWSFLRYAADRRNGDDEALWSALVKNTTRQGLDNLQHALGANPRQWMQDWVVSVYTDDAPSAGGGTLPLQSPERFTQPSWNFRALMPVLRVNGTTMGRYPLRTLPLTAATPESISLKGGGAAFFRVAATTGQRVAVRLTTSDLPAPSLLKVSVVRTK